MKCYQYLFLICVAIFPSAEGKLMFDLPIAGSLHGIRFYPSYSDTQFPNFDGKDVMLEPLEWNDSKQYLKLSISLWHMGRLSEEEVTPKGFLDYLSQFYPKWIYDLTQDDFLRHTEDHHVYQELYFSKDGKICEMEDMGFHLRIIENNRGSRNVTFYDAAGKPCQCVDGYHRGEVSIKGDAVIKEAFFDIPDDDQPIDISRPAVFPKGRMICYHQYKATTTHQAGVTCRERHKGWEAEVTASHRKTFYLKGRLWDFNDDGKAWLHIPEDRLRAKYYLEPYDMAEAEYTDKFGRLVRGLHGWARRCVDHYAPGSDLGGGRAVKETRYYDQNNDLSSDHLMKCAVIRFSRPEKGVQRISYFDEHGRELKHFQEEEEGPLEKESPYEYYSMLNEDISWYKPNDQDEDG